MLTLEQIKQAAHKYAAGVSAESANAAHSFTAFLEREWASLVGEVKKLEDKIEGKSEAVSGQEASGGAPGEPASSTVPSDANGQPGGEAPKAQDTSIQPATGDLAAAP